MIAKVKLECMEYFNCNPYSIETILSVSRRIGRDIDVLEKVVEALNKDNFLITTQRNGEKYFSLKLTSSQEVNQQEAVVNPTFHNDFNHLTSREKEVFHELVEGHTNIQIALRLIISPDTVKNHISSIYRKLKVNDRVKLIKIFYNSNTERN